MKFFALFLIYSMFSAPLHAAVMYQGVDISPVVNHFQRQVVTLNRPVTTYNWSEQNTGFVGWLKHFTKSELKQNDPSYVHLVKGFANSFWDSFGAMAGKENLYGFGLYTAEDPARTRLYGGFGSDWRLIQLQFPVGTRMLDFANFSLNPRNVLPADVKDILKHFNCSGRSAAQSLFEDGGAYLQPECRALVYEVFNNNLKVDVLAYDYVASNYVSCPSLQDKPRAFVVLRNQWMNADTVHVYIADSTVNLEERIRIQTLISKADTDKGMPEWSDYFAQTMSYQNAHPGFGIRGFQTLCDDLVCETKAWFCDVKNEKNCQTVTYARSARKDSLKINWRELKDSKVLWQDVLEKRKTPHIDQWLLQNHFDCSGKLPYDDAQLH